MLYQKISLITIFVLLTLPACQKMSEIERHAKHYQEHQDYFSLNQVVELMPAEVDTTYVRSLLGEPIDMGFDYRYLVDSVSPENCAVGAVFHLDEQGQIDDHWTGNICE